MTNSLIVLAVQARANLITRVGDDFLRLISSAAGQPSTCAGVGSDFEFQHAAVHDAADAHLIFPARHISGHQRILPLPHRLTNGAKLYWCSTAANRLATDAANALLQPAAA